MKKINEAFDKQYEEVINALVNIVAENYDLDCLTLKEVKEDGEVADEIDEWVRDNWSDVLSEDLVSYIDNRTEYYELMEKVEDEPYLMGSRFEIEYELGRDVREAFEKLVKTTREKEIQALINAIRKFGVEEQTECHKVHFKCDKPSCSWWLDDDSYYDLTFIEVMVNQDNKLTFLGFDPDEETEDDASEYGIDGFYTSDIKKIAKAINR